jgi:ribonuclease HI
MYNYQAARDYLTSIGISTDGLLETSFTRMCDGIVDALNTKILETKPEVQVRAVPAGKVLIYTDGACSGNPGPGGWGVVLMAGNHSKELSGAVENATNNRMELLAAIQALSALKKPCVVELRSDSSYMINAFVNDWISNWIKNGWKTAQRKPVENRDLWEQLVELSKKHTITFVKVKGHANDPFNNRCDELAVAAIKQLC